MNSEIQQKLEKLALKQSIAFCYSCYRKAPTGVCEKCHSDDLMRITENNGPEYGTNWIIEEILSELTPVDIDQVFEDFIHECYPETVTVGWMEFDSCTVMRELDPVSWKIAQNEWFSQEVEDGNFLTFDNGNNYYYAHDLEELTKEC